METSNMKFSNSDFHLMRWSLSAICASILLSGVILYGSSEYADFTQKDRGAAQSQMNDARNRLSMARQDQENLSVFSRGYDTLEKNKIIGDDHRPVSYTHLRAHETRHDLVCRLLLET